MKSLHDFKPGFQKALKPIASFLDSKGITPVQLMLISAAITLFAGLTLASAASTQIIFVFLPFILILRLTLNAVDELLIKVHKKESKLTFYLGELGDVFSDIVLYLPFIYIDGISQVLVMFNIFASIFTEFAGVLGLEMGRKRRCEGPMGKTDRAVAFSLVAVVWGFGILSIGWINFMLTVIFLAQALTIYNRVMAAIQKS